MSRTWVTAIEVASGDPLRTIETEARIDSSPAIRGEYVYLADRTRLIAVDDDSGTVVWEATADIPGDFRGVVADESCYATVESGVCAFDADTGDCEWSYALTDDDEMHLWTAPTVSGGAVCVPADAAVHAIADAR